MFRLDDPHNLGSLPLGDPGPFATDFLIVNVNDIRPNKFNHPTIPHHHQPVSEPDEWEKTCEEASNDDVLIFTLKRLAGIKASPETVSAAARIDLAGEPMATKHFDHYLSGHGATVNEDANIEDWITSNSVARSFIAKQVRAARQPSETNVHTVFEFNQVHYTKDNHRDSFGTIDHLEVGRVPGGGVAGARPRASAPFDSAVARERPCGGHRRFPVRVGLRDPT